LPLFARTMIRMSILLVWSPPMRNQAACQSHTLCGSYHQMVQGLGAQ